MAKAPLGSGERFKALEHQGMSPALAAWIGRKKYGKEKFQHLSEEGKQQVDEQKLGNLKKPGG
jgi:hypothetical protein